MLIVDVDADVNDVCMGYQVGIVAAMPDCFFCSVLLAVYSFALML